MKIARPWFLSAGVGAALYLLHDDLAFLREGYTFIANRARRHHTDFFATRLMLHRVVCMTGAQAARVFYVPDRFTRRRAIPRTTLMLLQDRGSVQTLDGAAHRHRKQMFVSLMTADRVQALADAAERDWRRCLPRWQQASRVVIDQEARGVLCRAVCEWAGIPANDGAVATLARDFGEMVDAAGHIGPQNWRAQVRRTRTEAWMRRLIEDVRRRRMVPPEHSALHTIAWHRQLDGRLLPVRIAAVELINVLRPTVAVGRFVTFVALALHDHPYCRWQLLNGRHEYGDWFVQEVRRFYPFFPAIGGRAQYDFDWNGRTFRRGDWVLLDVYGTNHDARIWHDPEVFRPERHSGADASGPRLVTAFDLIPQGGGSVRDGHRCPGEPITIELMKVAARFLASLDYDVPPQDLSVNLAEMPARPASGFVIANPRLAA